MSKVYVITAPENGWDCLIGVVSDKTPELKEYCEKAGWCILEAYSGVQSPKDFIDYWETM